MSEKAKERIEQEKKKKTGVLNLSDCNLESIPKEILSLTWLCELNLFKNRIKKIEGLETLYELKELNLNDNLITKITNLEKLNHLKELDLRHNQIKRIEGLETLIELNTLDLSENKFTIIEGLKTLTHLKKLQITNNKIKKIEGLETLTNLVKIDLAGNQIKEIEGLGSLTKLKELNLSYNIVSKIEGLNTLSHLNTLNLSGNKIRKIENLESLNELEDLDLFQNKIWKIEGLKLLYQLKFLDLTHNQIGKIEGLETLNQLKILFLFNNKIKKIEGLETLVQLNRLELYSNQITKIEGLESLNQLNELILYNNKIKKIEGLETLTNLNNIDLYNNQISKIEVLETLTNLNKIDLSSNQISKIEGLGKLKRLKNLRLINNKIISIEGLEKLTKLNTLELYRNGITKIEGLEALTKLMKLDLSINHIMKIEGLDTLKQLKSLGLFSNQIIKIEGLEMLTQLELLQLSINQIIEVEGLEKLICLNRLEIYGNKIKTIKDLKYIKNLDSIRSLYIHDNPITMGLNLNESYGSNHLQKVLNWLARQTESNLIPIKLPLKVVLLGNHTSGKSTLLHYLLKDEIKNQDSTHGLMIEYLDDPKAVFFDFGGQDYYHGLYNPFLSKDALYLILWKHSTNKNERILKDSNGFPCHHFDLSYWLAQKRYLENEVYSTEEVLVDDPKFVIQTFYKETGETGVEPNLGLADFEKMTLSLKPGNENNCKEQKQEITVKIKELLQQEKYQKQEPQWYVDFVDYLINEGKENYQFRNLVDLLQGESPIYDAKQDDKLASLKAELELLHRRGIVLYYPKINDQIYWLGPASFAKYVYEHVLVKDYLHKTISGIVHENDFIHDVTVIHILLQQKVLFYDKYNANYIIPGFLRLTSDDTKYHKNTENVNKPLFYLYFKEYLPFGYINQLISSIGQEGIHLHYWRDEVYFLFKEIRIRINFDYKNLKVSVFANQDIEQDLKAYLFYVLLAEYWAMKILKFEAYQNVKKYKISNNIDSTEEDSLERLFTKVQCRPNDLHISFDDTRYVKYQDIWNCEGTQVPFQELKDNSLRTSSNTISIIPFKELINSKNMELPKMKLKAFISYSKYDGEEFKDPTKGAGVNYLEKFKEVLSGLTEHREILEAWDDTKLIAGEDWDNRIVQELNSADIIFLLISSSFSNTKYIKDKELKIAFERQLQNECIVIPILVRDYAGWVDIDWIPSKSALPRKGHSIDTWKVKYDSESLVWSEVYDGIKQAINNYLNY